MAEIRLFSTYIEQILPQLIVPLTSRGLLEVFCSPDVNSDKVAQYLKANPYYEDQILKRVESLRGGGKAEVKPDTPRVEASIVLLGMQNSRNLILAMQAIRSVRGAHPDWGKDGNKLAFEPSNILKYALRAEEALATEKEADPGTAFAAGYLFDLIALLAAEKVTEKKTLGEVQTILEVAFVTGLKAAKAAMVLGKALPGFTLRKFLFSASLVHEIGKPIFAMIEPTYAAFDKVCTEKMLPNLVRCFAEQTKYGVNHEVMGAFACSGLGVLKAAEKSLLFQSRPHLLKTAKPRVRELASMLRLVSNMAHHPKIIEKIEDPILVQWKNAEITGLNLSPFHLMSASKRLF